MQRGNSAGSMTFCLSCPTGYLSWRDTKAAELISNRKRNFTEALRKIEESAPAQPNFKRALVKLDDTSHLPLLRNLDRSRNRLHRPHPSTPILLPSQGSGAEQ